MTQEITQKTCWSAPRSLGGAKHYFPPPLTPACQRLQFNLRRNIFQIKCPVQSTVSALQWYHTQRRPIWIRVIFVLPSVFASKLCWPLCVVRVMQPHQRLSFMQGFPLLNLTNHHMRSSEGESRCDHIRDPTSGWRDATSGWCQFRFPLLRSTCPLSTLQTRGLSTRTQVLKGLWEGTRNSPKMAWPLWCDHFGVTNMALLLQYDHFNLVWSVLAWLTNEKFTGWLVRMSCIYGVYTPRIRGSSYSYSVTEKPG